MTESWSGVQHFISSSKKCDIISVMIMRSKPINDSIKFMCVIGASSHQALYLLLSFSYSRRQSQQAFPQATVRV